VSDEVRIVTVGPDNVELERFFCYKSKPKTEGYRHKFSWLTARVRDSPSVHSLA